MRDLEQLVALLNERCQASPPVRHQTREEWIELMDDFNRTELLSISTSADQGWGLVPELVAAADFLLVTEQEWWV